MTTASAPTASGTRRTLGGGRYAVRMTDEGGAHLAQRSWRASGRHAPQVRRHEPAPLRQATTGVDGAGEADDDDVVDSIVDWRDRDDERVPSGAENDYYLDREPPYPAKNGDFDRPRSCCRCAA